MIGIAGSVLVFVVAAAAANAAKLNIDFSLFLTAVVVDILVGFEPKGIVMLMMIMMLTAAAAQRRRNNQRKVSSKKKAIKKNENEIMYNDKNRPITNPVTFAMKFKRV
jgi:hypothetical protein